MCFDVSIADKDRWENLEADGEWHRLTIGGKTAQKIQEGDNDFTCDLYGRQAAKALRVDGTVWVQYVRVPSDDATAPCPFPVSAADPDWAAVLGTFFTVDEKASGGVAVEYRTRVPGLQLKNRVFKADRR